MFIILKAEADCECGSTPTDWQCTDNNGTTYLGGQAGFQFCVNQRSDIWRNGIDCVYCDICSNSAWMKCQCGTATECGTSTPKPVATATCPCGSNVTEWQCTDNNKTSYQGGEAGYQECIAQRTDIWDSSVDCKYCCKVTGWLGSLGRCECISESECDNINDDETGNTANLIKVGVYFWVLIGLNSMYVCIV